MLEQYCTSRRLGAKFKNESKWIHVKEGLSETLWGKFEKLIPIIVEVSETCYREWTGCTCKEFEFKLTTIKVIFDQPYRRSPKELVEIKQVTYKLVDISDSEYCLQFSIKRKPEGWYRP